jgi:hypothetical protein
MSRSRRGARGKKGAAARPEVSQAFWGAEPTADPPGIRASTDPSATVRSLGHPPLRGHEVPAEYTFRLVYERASALAATLAAAAQLDARADDGADGAASDAG